MDLGLSGKVALITGGSEGIGLALASRLAAEGARVAICARREEVLQESARAIRQATGGEVLAFPCDVTDEQRVRAMVQEIVSQWGTVDILVNNAGALSAAPFHAVTDDQWDADIKLKIYGAIYCARAVLPYMQAARSGRIINISTPAGKAPGPESLPTSLSRASGIALTKAMSRDYAADNILVNAVCVGLIKSGQHERRHLRETASPTFSLEDAYRALGANVPLGRVGEAEEVADVICFLASERASYVTGVALNVDGGTSPVV